jgi:hypothetical protein
LPADQEVPHLTRAQLPRVFANVLLFDAEAGEPASLRVVGEEGPELEEALAHLRTLIGDQVRWSDSPHDKINEMPEEFQAFKFHFVFPAKTTVKRRYELAQEHWRDVLENVWPNRPLRSLAGKSPREAAQMPELHIALTAAVYVLDTFFQMQQQPFDVDQTLSRLGLAPLSKLILGPDTAPTGLSLMQMHRLDVGSLTDEQLHLVARRALLVRYPPFVRTALEEFLRRPVRFPDFEYGSAFIELVKIIAETDVDAALHWLEEGRRTVLGEHPAFQDLLNWDLHELVVRLNRPEDPALRPLTEKFVGYYAPKLPQLRDSLEKLFAKADVESPWSTSAIITPEMAAAESSAGTLWSPDREAVPAAGGKLWLPGQ